MIKSIFLVLYTIIIGNKDDDFISCVLRYELLIMNVQIFKF